MVDKVVIKFEDPGSEYLYGGHWKMLRGVPRVMQLPHQKTISFLTRRLMQTLHQKELQTQDGPQIRHQKNRKVMIGSRIKSHCACTLRCFVCQMCYIYFLYLYNTFGRINVQYTHKFFFFLICCLHCCTLIS